MAEINSKGWKEPQFVGGSIMSIIIVSVYMYLHIFQKIIGDVNLRKLPSYRLMIAIGIADMIPCAAHFLTGLYTFGQIELDYTLAKYLGVLATPPYVAYCFLTMVLALNRLLQARSPDKCLKYFGGRKILIWLFLAVIVWLIFAILLVSPSASITYKLQCYCWSYDEQFPLSNFVKKFEMYAEIIMFAVVGVCYTVVLITFIQKRRVLPAVVNKQLECRIFVQAFVITVYGAALNILWHNSELFPSSLWTSVLLNMMWVFNSCVYPLVHIIVNKTIKEGVVVQWGTTLTNPTITEGIAQRYTPTIKTEKDVQTVGANRKAVVQRNFGEKDMDQDRPQKIIYIT